MTGAIPILLVEDDPVDVVLVERALGKCSVPFSVTHAANFTIALATLEEKSFEAILIDLSLPDSFGVQGVERLVPAAPDTPVVVLTGLVDDQLAIEAIEAGAQDFLVKGRTNSELLERTLRYAIQRQQIQTENRLLLERLRQLARFDPLTGVLNRHSFAEQLDVEWARAERHGHPLSCVMLDIDFFKRINDTWGHSVGDLALKAVADVLQERGRNGDYVARYGGEEFCLLLTDTREDEAAAWSERLRQTITEMELLVGEDKLHLSASFGVATRRQQMTHPENLVEYADQALYLAKQMGRDQVVTYGRMRSLIDGRLQTVANSLAGVVARDMMTPMTLAVNADQPLNAVISEMLRARIEVVAVVDEQGSLIGRIGEDDMLTQLLASHSNDLTAGDVMQKISVCFPADTPIQRLCEFFSRAASRSVFVVTEKQPVGVITCSSVLRWITNSHALAHRPIKQRVLGPDRENDLATLLRELEQQFGDFKQLLGDQQIPASAVIGRATRLQDLLGETLSRAENSAVGS